MLSPRAAFHYDPAYTEMFYDSEVIRKLSQILTLDSEPIPAAELANGSARIAQIEVLLTGWGCLPLASAVLNQMPKLKAVFHAGGSTKHLAADHALFARGICLSTANSALAESVAEFTLALILLSTKRTWLKISEFRHLRTSPSRMSGAGNYRSTVGLIGFGAIARSLRWLLERFTLDVLVYDPYLSPNEAANHGVKLVALDQLFAESHVISCHLPSLPETAAMLDARLFRSMRTGATFINTARGSVVNEAGLVQVLRERSDLWAVLDVLAEEPPASGNTLFDLPNITFTPHIAGCLGSECRRMGIFIYEEIERWLIGKSLHGKVEPETLARRA